MCLCLERLPFPPPRTIKGKRSIAKQEEKLLYHKASLASQGKDANYPSLKPWGVVTSLCIQYWTNFPIQYKEIYIKYKDLLFRTVEPRSDPQLTALQFIQNPS